MAEFYEFLAVFLTSTGLLGGTVGAVLAYLLRQAKKDAEKKREERIAMELQRQEGEERLSEVVLALAHACIHSREPELASALQAYGRYLEKRRALRSEILSAYTVK